MAIFRDREYVEGITLEQAWDSDNDESGAGASGRNPSGQYLPAIPAFYELNVPSSLSDEFEWIKSQYESGEFDDDFYDRRCNFIETVKYYRLGKEWYFAPDTGMMVSGIVVPEDKIAYNWGVDGESLYVRYLETDGTGDIKEGEIEFERPADKDFTSYQAYLEDHCGLAVGYQWGSPDDQQELFEKAAQLAWKEDVDLYDFNPKEAEARATLIQRMREATPTVGA